MDPYQPSSSARYANRKRELPSGYTYIDDIVNGDTPVGKLVNVMGLVKDFQAPIHTKGSDYKCTISIIDKSVEDESMGLLVNIFGPTDYMPEPVAGDVLVVKAARVQSYRDSKSLITSKVTTSLHIYSASQIPRPPKSARHALQPSYGKVNRQLGESEHEYVSWLYHHMNKDSIPDLVAFQTRVKGSTHQKDKFCKLDSVIHNQFCDVTVHVVKAPFDEMEKTTLWVSDYTENDNFYKFSWEEARQSSERDGSSSGGDDRAAKWAGPFGRRSMQITCFEPHASYVNSDVQLGQWIHIRNLRIKLGNNGINLEGVLHEDRDFHRRQVEVLQYDDRDNIDPRLKEAIRRKLEYEKLKKKQMKSLKGNEEQGAHGVKRKADGTDEKGPNSRSRRKEMRQAVAKKVEQQEKQAEERLGLSDLVKCESQEQPVTPVSSIVEPATWKTRVDGAEVIITIPFSCAKYRTVARVVDFRPRQLEDFATWRKSTEADVLSDYGGDSDSDFDSEEEDDSGHSTQAREGGVWEWRFALQLEGVDPKSKNNDKFWAVVDNNEAQQLTGLDACDLRKDQDTLNTLREQLFKLWGNLEEAKLLEQENQIKNQKRVVARQPPPSSPLVRSQRQQQHSASRTNGGSSTITVSNKPFACCIRQYGVRIREPNPLLADAGEGRKWTRVFGLFGTKICS